jgi:hypothetical protein
MHLNDNIAQCLGLPRKRGQKFGIELEYEDWGGGDGFGEHWRADRDGSLRNGGIEFISNPLTHAQLPAAFRNMTDYLENTQANATERCGVHVHLNMLDSSWANLFSFSTLYTFLEPSIFKKYAPDRRDNHFCVPSYLNTALTNMMLEDVMKLRQGLPYAPEVPQPAAPQPQVRVARPRGHRVDRYQMVADDNGINREAARQIARNDAGQFRRMVEMAEMNDIVRGVQPMDLNIQFNAAAAVNPIPQDNNQLGGPLRILGASKYCALNFSRLHDLGTVESRIAPATRDMELVREWAEFLGTIQSRAAEFPDPINVVERYEEQGLQGLCDLVGLERRGVNRQDQDDAEDAATFMAGYIPPTHEELEWLAPQENV